MFKEIKDIKIKLEKLGYSNFISIGTLIGGQDNAYDSELKCKLQKNTFSIDVHDTKIVLDYSSGSLSKEKEFSSENELLEFLKKEFPIV